MTARAANAPNIDSSSASSARTRRSSSRCSAVCARASTTAAATPPPAKAACTISTVCSPNSCMPEVRSVRAELDDLDALVPLFDSYRQFYGQNVRSRRRAHVPRGTSSSPAKSVYLPRRRRRYRRTHHPALSVVLLCLDEAPLGAERSLRRSELATCGRRSSAAGARKQTAETQAKGLVLSTAITNIAAQHLCGWTRDDEYFHYHRFF